MNSKKNLLSVFLAILLFSLVVFFGCTSQNTLPPSTSSSSNMVHVSLVVLDDANLVIFSSSSGFDAGTNAFEAMKILLKGDLNFTKYDFGVMVNSIAKKSPSSSQYWALYMDGNYASMGIDSYQINSPMEIKWRLESISSFGS
ncbi:MAG: DUF4430 domain-containing protein [Candidatus Diapherotrites archaeon]|nr:DUF4430 domain-containing protein [Candidatus Diapherotrites archaeon]